MLDGDLRHGAVHERKQRLLDDDVEPAPLLARHLDLLREGRNDAVGQENAGEGADQRRADEAAEQLRRLIERAHGLDDAEHRGDDPERRQAPRRPSTSAWYGVSLLRTMVWISSSISASISCVPRISHDDQADIVADEMQQGRVGKHGRESP